VRRALELSQKQLAKKLRVKQAASPGSTKTVGWGCPSVEDHSIANRDFAFAVDRAIHAETVMILAH
jgi:hypothetical protein